MASPPERKHRALIGAIVFGLILFIGVWMRTNDLARVPPTGDESESAINALTILQSGTPRGTYLGLPIFENALTEPWLGNAEYEFRDSSYSKHDLAIYHGWLPLYSMAASFKFFGIEPDESRAELGVRHSEAEIRRRVVAARLPAALFGGAFIIFLFLAGDALYGAEAGWSAMVVGAIGRPFVYMGREARYHSATLALTTACCWATWQVHKHGRWRDYLIASVCFTLMFYTHLLAFLVASVMLGASVLLRLRKPGEWKKAFTAGAIVAAGAIPWIIGTGFLNQQAHIPPARLFLNFPLDLIWYPVLNVPYLLLPIAMAIWVIAVALFRNRLPARVVKPLADRRWEILFLSAWIALGFLVFTYCIPAASYFYKRLTLPIVGIGVVWGALIVSAAVRAILDRGVVAAAPIVFAITVLAGNMANLWFLEKSDRMDGYIAVNALRDIKLAPDTKLYCTPNDQLTLVFLAGLPVQSVAPIRKTFLDDYPGPILMIDSSRPYGRLDEEHVSGVAHASEGVVLTKEQAYRDTGISYMRAMREYYAGKVAAIDPPTEPEPTYAAAVVDSMREEMSKYLNDFYQRGTNTPVLRGYVMRDWSDWWPLFFYRFVNPTDRMGDRLNYVDRIKSSRAQFLPSGWVFLHCPRKGEQERVVQ